TLRGRRFEKIWVEGSHWTRLRLLPNHELRLRRGSEMALGFGKFFGLAPRENVISTARLAKTKLMSLCRDLLSEQGEVSGRRLAGEALLAYASLEVSARAEFFDWLLEEFVPDPQEVGQAGDAYRKEPTSENLARIQRAVESRRQ